MQLVGKLTPKALGWDRIAIGGATAKVPADGGRVFLGRIAGIVGGFRETLNSDTGEVQRGLKGNFRGMSSRNVTDDKGNDTGVQIVVTSGVCYLPGGIQEMIEGSLLAAQDVTSGGNAKATVQFAIDLYAIPATNKAGYSFTAETLVEAAQSDPLALLLAQAEGTATPALEAPADETPTVETPVEPEKATAKK